jgi:hypothetical protein
LLVAAASPPPQLPQLAPPAAAAAAQAAITVPLSLLTLLARSSVVLRTELARSSACEALCKVLNHTAATTAAAVAAAAAGDSISGTTTTTTTAAAAAAAAAADSAAWLGAVAVCALAERCATAAVRLRSAGGVGIIGRGLARALKVGAAADSGSAGKEVDDVGSVMLEALGSGDEVLIVIEVCNLYLYMYHYTLICAYLVCAVLINLSTRAHVAVAHRLRRLCWSQLRLALAIRHCRRATAALV